VEDAFTVGLAVLAAFHPVVILVILLLFLLLLVWLTPKVFRAIRRMLGRIGEIMSLARIRT
jgi:hypothetical protein